MITRYPCPALPTVQSSSVSVCSWQLGYSTLSGISALVPAASTVCMAAVCRLVLAHLYSSYLLPLPSPRLVCEGTVEENVLKKANQKRRLGELAIESGAFTTEFFTEVSLSVCVFMLIDVQ